jgi:hypothetical protein
MTHTNPSLLFVLAAAVLGTTPGMAESLSDPIKDAEVKRMKDDIEVIKAQQDLLAARYPTIAGGKEGTVTVQSQALYPFAAQVETYRALQQTADKICGNLKGKYAANVTVVPLDYSLASSITAYTMGLSDLKAIKSVLQSIHAKPRCTSPGGAGAAATPGQGSTGSNKGEELGTLPLATAASALTSVVDFAKLFRVDRTIHIESPQMGDADLAVAVATCLPNAILLEDAILRNLTQTPAAGKHEESFLATLQSAKELRSKIQHAISGQDCPAQTLAGLKAFDDYYTALGTGDNTKLNQLLKAEAVVSALNGDAASLFVGIKSAGAATQLTDGFFSGQKLYASGGIVAQYVLRKGVVATDMGQVIERTNFKKIPLND